MNFKRRLWTLSTGLAKENQDKAASGLVSPKLCLLWWSIGRCVRFLDWLDFLNWLRRPNECSALFSLP